MKVFRSLSLLMALLVSTSALAQFGQNKPRYRDFDFRVLSTPTYDIYYYTENEEYIKSIADQAEKWYKLHQVVLRDTFTKRNPMILYNNHAEFQQTNAIFGSIGTGTGGVTEGFKNRVIFPFTFTNQQTNHVLGHELVHAFQYHMVIGGDSTSMESLGNLPLWMVEGLAEYLSIGKVDPHTAMWMRDAVLNDEFPTIKELSNPKFFPYRYGQAFWSYVAGTYGDQIIEPLFMGTAKYGFAYAVDSLLQMDADSFSNKFKEDMTAYFEPYLGDKSDRTHGKKIISDDNAGRLNISPAMSPNGRYVIFLSEKNVFSTDLFLADARSGEIIRKITSTTRDGHLDDISFLESAGTWSPNSKQFAFIAVDKGRNIIVIKEAETGKTIRSIKIPEVPAISNPTWSPDGDRIVFSGLVEGQVDLYAYDLDSDRLTQLTNDKYSEIQADFSADGTHLTFATDHLSIERGMSQGKWKMNVAVMNLETGNIGQINMFNGADNLNPSFDHEGNIIFLSDRDGYRNIYKYMTETGEVLQLTEFWTGASGITKYSPALSVSRSRDRLVYTHYLNGRYSIYQSQTERMINRPVDKDSVDFSAGTLPVVDADVQQVVQGNLDKYPFVPAPAPEEYQETPFESNFRFTYATPASVGVGVSTGSYGSRVGLASGISFLFSDILGNHIGVANLAVNGELLDIGGQLQYINMKNQFQWGVSLSHIPFRTGFVNYSLDTLQFQDNSLLPVIREDVNILRIFEDQLSLIAEYPFSKHLRLEANAGINYRFFRLDKYPNYYDSFTGRYFAQGDREKVPIGSDEINLGGYLIKKGSFYNFGTALVGDNASFGLTSPLDGHRYRLDVTKYLGTYDFISTTADGRLYRYLRPVSLAFRFQHFARYGQDANSFNPILIGWMGLVHGFDYNQIIKLAEPADNIQFDNQLNVAFARLSGSKFALSSVEVRLPFTGPERLAQIRSGVLFSDLALFFDAGVAYDDFSHFSDGEPITIQEVGPDGGITPVTVYEKPKLAMSAGLALRINLFGALILEPYIAYPIQENSKFLFGFNFVPGW